jgi:hypothetical protein
MELCLAIMLAAKKAGILAGGDGKDGTHVYTVVDARDPVTVVIRPTGRATLSTVESDKEHHFTLNDEDDVASLFETLAKMLIEENLDTKANRLLKIIESMGAQADSEIEADGDNATVSADDSEEDDTSEDDEEEYEEEARVTQPSLLSNKSAALDLFEQELATAAQLPMHMPAVDLVVAPVETAASALMSSCVDMVVLTNMTKGDFTVFQIMAALAEMVGHTDAARIFNAVQTFHEVNGILPGGVGELADQWIYKLMGYVVDTAGPITGAEVRGTLISYMPMI